jgi:hypothetical protein
MTEPEPISRVCPKCGTHARQLVAGWESLPNVQCALCREMYALPDWGVMVATVSEAGDAIELSPSRYGSDPGLVTYYALEVSQRSMGRRLGDAVAGFVAGWRGDA